MALFIFPLSTTHAGVLANFTGKVKSIFLPADESVDEKTATSQTMPALKAIVVEELAVGGDGTDEAKNDTTDSLSAVTGPLRVSTEQIVYPADDTISVYEVKKGDSLASIAGLFNVTKNTIIWANDLKSEKISPGDTLVILPVTGIKYTAKKGDTVASIAKKYKGDADDISSYNGISKTKELAAGDVIIVPEGELAATLTSPTIVKKAKSYLATTPIGFLVRPLVGGIKTQGIHGNNGIDIGVSRGTSIVAAAAGSVLVAKSSGYNGGYGQMIVLSHANGIQTVYAHLSSVHVSPGQTVEQGQVIGASGNTGRSSGPHLHFEVRGAKNPF
jgi:murein DD-endopeptidase MepM/ murein hydrolase activator NlpD